MRHEAYMGGIHLSLKILIFGLLAGSGAAHAGTSQECLAGLGPALISGGFTGSVDCDHDQISLREIGQLPTPRRTFTVLSYRYRLEPVCTDCAVHGGQRIIIMDGDRYVGQYESDFVTPSIEHGSLVLRAYGEAPVKVAFTRNGPPSEIRVAGQTLNIFK